MSQAGSQLGRIEQLMDASSLRTLIDDVAAGRCTPDDAVRQLRRLPYSDLGFARVDHHRDLRLGIPEAVWPLLIGRTRRGLKARKATTCGFHLRIINDV